MAKIVNIFSSPKDSSLYRNSGKTEIGELSLIGLLSEYNERSLEA